MSQKSWNWFQSWHARTSGTIFLQCRSSVDFSYARKILIVRKILIKLDNILMLCAGTGITPMVRIIEKILRNEKSQTKIQCMFACRFYREIVQHGHDKLCAKIQLAVQEGNFQMLLVFVRILRLLRKTLFK